MSSPYYWKLNKFNIVMNPLKVVAVNSQGYFENEINRFVNSHREKPDVLICTEHKQRDLSAIRDSVRGYTLASGYQASTGQRGSAVFVRDGLDYEPRRDLNMLSREGTFESASVEVSTPGNNVVVTGLYRSPNSSVTEHNRDLNRFANYISKESDKVHVIGGDLNIDLTTNRTTTNEVLNDNNLRYHIRSATHDAGRCLDNFITSVDSGCTGRRLTSAFSDHRPVQLQVPLMSYTGQHGWGRSGGSSRRNSRTPPYGRGITGSIPTHSGGRRGYSSAPMRVGSVIYQGFE